MYELIICEKPKASLKIAQALADGKPVKASEKGVPYYKITHGKTDIVVASAVGHLYGLAQKSGKKSEYPVYDIEWVPTSDTSKQSSYTKKYLAVLKKLCKDAKDITIATDYDVEGEVIGLNIVRYACKRKDANRMKFSTLTKPDLVNAYEHKSSHLDWGQAHAGETRHILDWFYGINTSRALTTSIKKAGYFKIMSTGRVQGPSLKLIVDREKEIQAFKPEPFWQIQLLGEKLKQQIEAWHKEDKFKDKKKAESVFNKVKSEKSAKVDDLSRNQFNQAPPFPFDLTTLQTEAHRCLHISPKDTLAIAQILYIDGLISYPRTSSQQLPPEIGFKNILSELKKIPEYKDLVSQLLKKPSLSPNNGKKTDPAHPAIYPTGLKKVLEGREQKIYDLIVKRFFATFSDPATRETMTITLSCKDEPFIAKGTRTVARGWYVFYDPYVHLKEEELPEVKKGEDIKVSKISLLEKETQPPNRYSESSIIRELEKRNLGTKATRAQIIDTLEQRGYIEGKPLHATNIGIRTCDTLEKYSPMIVDEELTREFELEMDEIREDKKTEDDVLVKAKVVLNNILDNFRKKESDIGKELMDATIETRDEQSNIGLCPKCKKGTLSIRRGKFGNFVACNSYPECETTFSLPKGAMFRPAKEQCKECGFPKILAIRKGRKPQEICINPDCPTKKLEAKQEKEIEQSKKICPKCKKPLILRRSVYGAFLGCSGYPKCRHTEKIDKVDKPASQ